MTSTIDGGGGEYLDSVYYKYITNEHMHVEKSWFPNDRHIEFWRWKL